MATITRHHIPAGSYQIAERGPILLQAFLGTCVAVSLYCRRTGIGGIIHLLLPQPVPSLPVTQPEKYASTGLPLVLHKMLQMGARREAMVACIAGGALVGKFSRQELDLDIGGRTVDVVRQELTAGQINILHSETGGFFTCCLNLDMRTGAATIQPVGGPDEHKEVAVRRPTASQIKTTTQRLAPIPQVVLKVLRMFENKDLDIHLIADEIRRDQVMTAQILKLANASLFARHRTVESLNQALVYLGQDQIIKLVLSAAVKNYFEGSSQGYSLRKGGLYHHAVGCAQVAEALAAKTGRMDPGAAYTAGLLHDIGKVVLDQYLAPVFPLFYHNVIVRQADSLDAERELLGTDHTKAGGLLAEEWELPTSLGQVIRHHHAPEGASQHKILTVIVHLADLLLSRFQVGIECERISSTIIDRHLRDLELSTASLADLVDLMPRSVFETEE